MYGQELKQIVSVSNDDRSSRNLAKPDTDIYRLDAVLGVCARHTDTVHYASAPVDTDYMSFS